VTKTASERAVEINAETRAWIAAAPGRGAGLLVEDEAHWARIGIHTAEELDHYLAAAEYVDLYKDIHGIKPRWVDTRALTVAEINAMISALVDSLDENEEDDEVVEPLTHNPFAALKGMVS